MKLLDLIPKKHATYFSCSMNEEITGLACKIEDVKCGCIFFCFEGRSIDSHSLAKKAIDMGAACLVVERHISENNYIIVKNSRKTMCAMAKIFYGNCADMLQIITIVGTNGKTTTSHILKSIFDCAGYKTGLIGTCGITILDAELPNEMTTPDPIELHKTFSLMLKKGVQIVIMEASAHSLYLHKLYGIFAAACIFTNFSQDHLDYFHTMYSYKKAKTKYFVSCNMQRAILNVDDVVGRELQLQIGDSIETMSYGLSSKADMTALNICTTLQGSEFVACHNEFMQNIKFALCGDFNVYNCLAACTAACSFGIDLPMIAKGISNVKSVDGRFMVLESSTGYYAIVDYAHTPDGMEKVLAQTRELAKNKMIVVFGCGGNRDTSKRKKMGAIASKYCDLVVISTDNPRFESPQDIMIDIQKGIDKKSFYMMIEEREMAISYALEFAGSGDVVIILGKGHENYQEIAEKKHHFSDIEIVRKYIT